MFHLPNSFDISMARLRSVAMSLVVLLAFSVNARAQDQPAQARSEPARPVIRAQALPVTEQKDMPVEVAPPPKSAEDDVEEIVVAIPVTTPEAVKKPTEEKVMPANVDISQPEKVDEKDSTVKKAIAAEGDAKALPKIDLTKKSVPDRPDQLGSSILTRTEARTFTFSVPAPRGQILDRNGYPLAQTKVAWYASISFPMLGKEVEDEVILRYAGERIIHVNKLLGTDWDLSGKTVIQHYRNRRWLPLVFSSTLTAVQVDMLKKQGEEGLTLHPVYQRHYPNNELLSHVIGYLGQRPPVNTGPILKDEPLWRFGKGVDGLEKSFEHDLRGTSGRTNILYEGDGTKIKEDILDRPKQGYNVITSIDLEMQQIVERLLAEKVKHGAMVIMDCRTGDIMAMASFPQFNPNDFIPAISQALVSTCLSRCLPTCLDF